MLAIEAHSNGDLTIRRDGEIEIVDILFGRDNEPLELVKLLIPQLNHAEAVELFNKLGEQISAGVPVDQRTERRPPPRM